MTYLLIWQNFFFQKWFIVFKSSEIIQQNFSSSPYICIGRKSWNLWNSLWNRLPNFHQILEPSFDSGFTSSSNGHALLIKMAAMSVYGKKHLKSSSEPWKLWDWVFVYSIGLWGLPDLFQWWTQIDLWPFYGKVNFASLLFCMRKILQMLFCHTAIKTIDWILLYVIKDLNLNSSHTQRWNNVV